VIPSRKNLEEKAHTANMVFVFLSFLPWARLLTVLIYKGRPKLQTSTTTKKDTMHFLVFF